MFIAFSGAKGSGKTTAADYLVQHHGFTRVSMATGLKKMMMALGCTEDQVYGDSKEVPNPLLCGKTTRHAMQTLGTEWGRELIGQDIWVNAAEYEIQRHLSDGHNVVCDDIRFPNERAMLDRLAGTMVLVRRELVESGVDEHPSERHWRTMQHEAVIQNEGTMEDLFAKVDEVTHALRNGTKCYAENGA